MIFNFLKKSNLDNKSVILNINLGENNDLLEMQSNIDNSTIYYYSNNQDNFEFENVHHVYENDLSKTINELSHVDFVWINNPTFCLDFIINKLSCLKHTEYLYVNNFNEDINRFIATLSGDWMIRFNFENNVLLENLTYRNSFIDEHGIWNMKNSNEHVFDLSLAHNIYLFLTDNNVNTCLDLGCGEGKYVDYLNKKNILTNGYDGNPFTKFFNSQCDVLDISTSFDLEKKYDCVICLEVGEHIPQKYEDVVIDNICKHTNKYIILSWAIPNQGGYGHVNCATNEYIKNKFYEKGFETLEVENDFRIRADSTWFQHTIMVFEKHD